MKPFKKALQPLFAHLPQVHVIHDDIVIATITIQERVSIVEEVMQILCDAGLTLNRVKCVFGEDRISFWGMIVSADGICPDPEKVKALYNLATPTNNQRNLVRLINPEPVLWLRMTLRKRPMK